MWEGVTLFGGIHGEGCLCSTCVAERNSKIGRMVVAIRLCWERGRVDNVRQLVNDAIKKFVKKY